VNMNQLAHMALQHQGLCPAADQKPECEHAGRGPPHTGHHGVDRWEDFDPRGQRLSPQHTANVAGVGVYIGFVSKEVSQWKICVVSYTK